MKPRKKIIPPKLRDYFQFEKSYGSINTNLYFNTQIFNGFTFFVAIILASSLLGFYRPIFWALAITFSCLLTFLYYKTLKLCEGLSVIRIAPTFGREKSNCEIFYHISNETGFPISDLSFYDEFEGTDLGYIKVDVCEEIPAHTQIRIKQNVVLNAGMGLKSFMPIKINFRDELGIFDFKVEYLHSPEMEVYPHIEETPQYKNSVSPSSIDYGFYEIAKRGDSNLFIGTREYRHGDPVKHINWKLTKKTSQVVVNEYEKSTNTFITILMELNLKNQTGSGEISTWELAKDLALSICHNELSKNNSIQIIANNLYIPFGTGQKQLNLIEKHFTTHELNHSDSGFMKHLSDVPRQSQVYYICPSVFTSEIIMTVENLKKIKEMGHQVIIFILNPIQEMAITVHGKQKLILLEMHRQAQTNHEKLVQGLSSHGIPVIPISIQKNVTLYEQMVKESKGLLEVK